MGEQERSTAVLSHFHNEEGHSVFLYACEGTGDNLFEEDVERGYVDYVYYTLYSFEDGAFVEADGGEILLKKPFREVYPAGSEVKLLEDVLKFHYDGIPYYQILK